VAVARPIPVPAPVMKATLPASRGIGLPFLASVSHDSPVRRGGTL
jgi:hypothetical protein